MGAWGTDHFENDTAADWGYDLESETDLTLVRSTIEAALADADLNADAGCQVLAACEVIARLRGEHGVQSEDSAAVDAWVRSHPMPVPPELVDAALRAIDRVLTAPSELLELWEETEHLDEWRSRVADLRKRVAGA